MVLSECSLALELIPIFEVAESGFVSLPHTLHSTTFVHKYLGGDRGVVFVVAFEG